MIKRLVLLATLISILCFASCDDRNQVAREDVSVSELSERLESAMSNRELLEDSSERYINSKVSRRAVGGSATEYVMKTSLSQVCDEYGVIKAASGDDAVLICEEINLSLKRRREEWDDRYYAKEKPKIFAAEARQFGIYVIYGVLDPTELDTVFSLAEDTIYH